MNSAIVLKPSDGADKERHAKVRKNLIDPVCKDLKYKIVPLPKKNEFVELMEPVVSLIFTTSLVIVDLGLNPFDCKLAMQIGYRRGAGRPIVYIRDRQCTVSDLELTNHDCVTYDQNDLEASRSELKRFVNECACIRSAWSSHCGILEQRMPLGDFGKATYTYANEIAAQMLGFRTSDEIVGRKVSEIDKPSRDFMRPAHLKEYDDDQNAILGYLQKEGSTAFSGDTTRSLAKVPMWFETHRHPPYQNRLIWPVITQHRLSDQAWFLRMALIDLSLWSERALKSPPDDVVTFPHAFCRMARPYDLFLSYSTADQQTVLGLYRHLTEMGLKVWLDVFDLNGNGDLIKSIVSGMRRSRALAVIVGPHGLGRYQYTHELVAELMRRREADEAVLTLLLPDVTRDSAQRIVPEEIWHLISQKLFLTVDKTNPQGSGFMKHLVKFLVGILKEC